MFVLIELCQQTQERRRVSWWEEGNEGREKKGREERRKMKFREKEKKDRKIERKAKRKKEKNLFTQFSSLKFAVLLFCVIIVFFQTK